MYACKTFQSFLFFVALGTSWNKHNKLLLVYIYLSIYQLSNIVRYKKFCSKYKLPIKYNRVLSQGKARLLKKKKSTNHHYRIPQYQNLL